MTTFTETHWHRRQIEAFIDAEPMDLHLERPERAETEAGGAVKGEPRTLPKQRFRFTPFKRRLVNESWFSLQGEKVRRADWVLHGKHDADVKVGDFFQYRDHEYEVIWVSDHNLYRTAAGVINRSKTGSE